MLFAAPAAYASPEDPVEIRSITQLNDQDFISESIQKGNFVEDASGNLIIKDTRSAISNVLAVPACIACVNAKFVVKKVGGSTKSYGSWITKVSGMGPGSLSKSVAVSASNSYTGTLSASKSLVNASVGFNITQSYTDTVTYTGTVPKGKRASLQVRSVFQNYKVRQDYYIGKSLVKTTYVYPKKYAYPDFRLKY